MHKVFVALATLLWLAVAAQFFLAAMGAFDTAPKDESFQLHGALGYGILLFAVVLTLLAALARLPGRLIGMTGLVAGLVLLQPVIVSIAGALRQAGGNTSTGGELVFGLHAVNALIIMGLAQEVRRKTCELVSSPASAAAPSRTAEPMS